MVKFGRHLQFYLECDELTSGGSSKPYIVPYKKIRGTIGESQQEFQQSWMESLNAASVDYTQRVRDLWQMIFADLFRLSQRDVNVLRGLPHEDAVELYLATMSDKKSRDLLTTIKRLYSNASMNLEALRKLVKKYDKHCIARGDDILTNSLLPELYSSSVMDASVLVRYIEILRDKLVMSEEEEEEESLDEYMSSIREKTQLKSSANDSLDERRASEMFWLHDLFMNKIPKCNIPMLVVHRGFHSVRDHSGKRRLENSLSSYESAWSAGVHLCGCSVALTKDERLVLAHDISTLENNGVIFKIVAKPPLLLDLLRSAKEIGGTARLVVELKAGNNEASSVLVRLLRRHPDLIERCAVIMSFDAFLMHKLRTELNELSSSFHADSPGTIPYENDQGLTLSKIKLPNLLLLTAAKRPTKSFELSVSVTDFSQVDSWLQHQGRPSLDGVYLQFQPEMLEPEGLAALRGLTLKYEVGVWTMPGDLDDFITAAHLIEGGGVSYVNTELPRGFIGHGNR